MGALFSDNVRQSRRPAYEPAPLPPPGAVGSFFDDEPAPAAPPLKRPSGIRFDAELDLSELDDRDRPGPVWIARGRELGRGHMVFRSRRMCYLGRRILAAVHLVDDKPVPLFGRVTSCEYDVDGLYKVELELLAVPERAEISAWLDARAR